MTVLVTGASGFLGKYVVAEVLRLGYQTKAVIRPSSNEKLLPWLAHPQLELVSLDLQDSASITEAMQGIDTVIHLAAVKTGDCDTLVRGNLKITENILHAMKASNVDRLVAISSFSVFNYLNIPAGTTIDENSPLESRPKNRDAYAQMKLSQEELIRNFEKNHNLQVTYFRPGAIYGKDNLWTARLGVKVKQNIWIRIGSSAQIPLTYVENCAEAIVKALGSDTAIGETFNIVDDNPPTQQTYTQELIKRIESKPTIIPVSWSVINSLATIIWWQNTKLLGGKLKLPNIAVPATLHARFQHFRYSNNHLKELLGWTPKYSLGVALDKSIGKN